MLSLKGVTRRYNEVTALNGLDFDVPGDRYIALLGASGSGKTTLLRVIAGFEEPDAGQIMLNDQRLDGVPIHKRDVGFVFQNFALFPHLSVAENVAFGLRHRARDPITDEAILTRHVADMLELVGLTGLGNRAIGAISGGQRQRVALARTLITEPRIVLLDEPLGALDANLRERMCDELRAIRRRLGITFLHVTGSESEALTMGDEVAVLSGGRIAQSAPPTDLFARPTNAEAARHLNAWNIFAGQARGGVLVTGAGPLPMPRALPDGASAEMAIRFDQIGVCPPGQAPEGQDRVTARYIAGEFNGATALAFFRAEDGGLIQVVDHLGAPRLPDLREGDTYDLHFPPTEALLFEKAKP